MVTFHWICSYCICSHFQCLLSFGFCFYLLLLFFLSFLAFWAALCFKLCQNFIMKMKKGNIVNSLLQSISEISVIQRKMHFKFMGHYIFIMLFSDIRKISAKYLVYEQDDQMWPLFEVEFLTYLLSAYTFVETFPQSLCCREHDGLLAFDQFHVTVL